jgi:ABC-type polysaccharide/polyol phosphate transport system ATPase subunit
VLGVGDASFRKKSEKRVKDMIAESGTVVIVSHSLAMLKTICDRIIVLESGSVLHEGDVEVGLDIYVNGKKDTNN